jgi:hypothetical protein
MKLEQDMTADELCECEYPGHCADYYAGMCRFNIPYVRNVIKAWVASGKLKVTVDLDESVELA